MRSPPPPPAGTGCDASHPRTGCKSRVQPPTTQRAARAVKASRAMRASRAWGGGSRAPVSWTSPPPGWRPRLQQGVCASGESRVPPCTLTLNTGPSVLPYGTVHGWLNNSSTYPQDLESVQTQPIDAFPENAPRWLDHTADFRTRFYLFARPIKLNTLMSPPPAHLDSLAWKLG